MFVPKLGFPRHSPLLVLLLLAAAQPLIAADYPMPEEGDLLLKIKPQRLS